MGFSVHWRWLAALLGLLCMGCHVQCTCTEDDMHIEGGTYKLTRNLEVGSMLIYNCPEGQFPYPHNTRLCQPNGSWKPAPKRFSPQRCRLVECPDPNVLEHGTVYPPQENYFVGNETTYECNSGHTLEGSLKRICLPNGKWSGSTPICGNSGDTCADPGIPAGASRRGVNFGTGGTVTYSCNGGLLLVGSKDRVCQENGEWTGTEPACYYKHTYDTALEVSQEFGGAIKATLGILAEDARQKYSDADNSRKIRISKNGALNIYIAVDVSMRISMEQIAQAKSVISTLISKISSFDVAANYEILFFACEVHEVVSILDFWLARLRLADALSRLDDFTLAGKVTASKNLNLVFQTFLERMAILKYLAGEEAFQDHRHVLLVFTDGAYDRGGSPAPTVAKIKNLVYMNTEETQSREEFLDIYIFGIGEDIFDEDLQPLTAGTGGKHYFRMSKIDNMNKLLDDIIDEEDVKGLCGLHKDYGTDKRSLYPWMAFVIVQGPVVNLRQMGSLVSPEFVLTAAHCLPFGVLPEHVTVELDDGQRRVKRVKAFFIHPKYDVRAKVAAGVSEFYDYDVALIQLQETVTISHIARPICIPCTKETNNALKLYGASSCSAQEQLLLKSHDENLSFLTRTSNMVDVKNVYAKLGDNRDECNRHALSAEGITTKNVSEVVTDRFLCTGGFMPQRQHIACIGDGGGAVFKNYMHRTIQVAAVSWGTKPLCSGGGLVESDANSRDFHINLFRVVPFLKSILGNEDQDEYAPLEFLNN